MESYGGEKEFKRLSTLIEVIRLPSILELELVYALYLFNAFGENDTQLLVSLFPNLESLFIKDDIVSLEVINVSHLFPHPKLRSFRSSGLDCESVFPSLTCPLLESLIADDIIWNSFVSDLYEDCSLDHLTNVVLRFDGMRQQDEWEDIEDIINVLSFCSSIETLEVKMGFRIMEIFYKRLPHFDKLRSLTLESNWIYRSAYPILQHGMKDIKELTLKGSGTDEYSFMKTLEKLIDSHPEVKIVIE